MDHWSSFLSNWLATALVGAALVWYADHYFSPLFANSPPRLVYRSSKVLLKPADELISLLGLDVPVAPTLSLARLKADGLVLIWKPHEPKLPGIKHNLVINGITGMLTHSGFSRPADAFSCRAVAPGDLDPDFKSSASMRLCRSSYRYQHPQFHC